MEAQAIGVRKPLQREYILLAICIAASFIVHVVNIQNIYMPMIYYDELGYWSNGAFFAGLDWANQTHNAYYSYGYSLLLAPLFALAENPIQMYQAALVMNCVLMAAIVPIAYRAGKLMFPATNMYVLLAASFVFSIYGGYMIYADLAFSECLVMFLGWLLFLVALELAQHKKIWMFALFGLVLGYAYMVHSRMMGFVIAGAVLVVALLIKRKITWKQVCVFAACLIAMLLLHRVLKSIVQENVYSAIEPGKFRNEMGAVFERTKDAGTLTAIVRLLEKVCGNLYYLGAASLLLVFPGMDVVFRGLWNSLKSLLAPLFRKKGGGKASEQETAVTAEQSADNYVQANYKWGLAFMALALALSILISSVFLHMIKNASLQYLLYGRYSEMALGPVMLIGFLILAAKPNYSYKKVIVISVLFFLLGGLVEYIIRVRGIPGDNFFVMPSVNWQYLYGHRFTNLAVIPVLAFIGIYLLLRFRKDKILTKILALAVCVLFFAGSVYLPGEAEKYSQMVQAHQSEAPARYLDEVDPDLYYAWVPQQNSAQRIQMRGNLRFLHPEGEVIVVNSKKADERDAMEPGRLIMNVSNDPEDIALLEQYAEPVVDFGEDNPYSFWQVK